jgi:hypothetical protein
VRELADASQDPSRSRDTHYVRIKRRKEGIGDTTHDTHTSKKDPEDILISRRWNGIVCMGPTAQANFYPNGEMLLDVFFFAV